MDRLFKDVTSTEAQDTGYSASRYVAVITFSESERTDKEAILIYFQIFRPHSSGGSEDNKNIPLSSRCPWLDSKRPPSESVEALLHERTW
jgi:hypothetical protein